MQRDRLVVAQTWYRTAERDLRLARAALDIEPSLATFHAQQAAAKTLKAVLVALTDDHPRIHTAGRLIRELRRHDALVTDDLERDAAALDLLYLTSRYPDTIGDPDPGDVIARDDGALALTRAERLLSFAQKRLAEIVM